MLGEAAKWVEVVKVVEIAAAPALFGHLKSEVFRKVPAVVSRLADLEEAVEMLLACEIQYEARSQGFVVIAVQCSLVAACVQAVHFEESAFPMGALRSARTLN